MERHHFAAACCFVLWAVSATAETVPGLPMARTAVAPALNTQAVNVPGVAALPVPVVAETAPNGATAAIHVRVDTSTWMPCSQTSTLAGRHFEIEVNAQIGYTDFNGVHQVYSYRDVKPAAVGPFASNEAQFTFLVQIPSAQSVTAVIANVRVAILHMYGIHGWFIFTYDGAGSSPSAVIVVKTQRVAQEKAIDGATTLWGLLPEFENRSCVSSTVPAPPPPPPPATCYFSYFRDGGSGLLGLSTRGEKFPYATAVNACASGGGYVPQVEDFQREWGMQMPAGCAWTSSIHNDGGRLVVFPNGSLATTSEETPCHVMCRRPGCMLSAPEAPEHAKVPVDF